MKNCFIRPLLSVSLVLFFSFSSFARMDGDVKTTLLNVDTDHGRYSYEIHLPISEEGYLNRLVHILKNDTVGLSSYFKYAPKDPIHFTLEEDSQESNGSAAVVPINHIVLRKFPPVGSEHLSSSSNSLKKLVIHELIHIIHMDQTRGLLKGLRTVFGSVGKLGGVVPRWFVEGIATWGESALTDSGRLKNELLRSEWERVFSSEDFCKTIDCLDQPGEFPYGQYAYWTGAFFMEYLEGLKENSVQCLIFANSNNIPFFLNSAFNECFGKSAITMYEQFRTDTLSKLRARVEEDLPGLPPIKNAYGIKTFQEGVVLIGDNLYSVEYKDKVQKVVEQNLKTKESKIIDFSGRLSGIERWNENNLSIKTFSNIRLDTKRERTIYNSKGLSRPEHKGDYNFSVGGREVSFKFSKMSWVINDGEYVFPEEVSLFAPKAATNGVYFKLFDSRRGELLIAFYDTTKKKLFEAMTVNEDFTIIDSCGENLVVRTNNELKYLTQNSISKISTPFSNRVILGSFSNERAAVVLKNSLSGLYIWDKGCLELQKSLESKKEITFKEVDLGSFSSPSANLPKRSYPRGEHFIPKYWMFNYTQATDALSYWSIMTSISDPDKRHTLNLMAVYYSETSEVTPDVSYIYEFPNDFYLSLSHSKRFFSSSWRLKNDYKEVSFASLSKIFEIGNFDLVTSLYGSLVDVDDYISNREEKEYGAILSLNHVRARYDDFFSKFQLKSRLFRRDIEGSKGFNGIQSIAKLELNPFNDFYFGTELSYGSLDKDTFKGGVLYGGGSYTEYHQFYGIPYNDIRGNEIKTLRASIVYNLLDIYRGPGLLPVFMNEFSLLGGTDIVAADGIIVGNRYLINSSAQSYWAGVRADLTIAYAIPVSIDIIRTRVINRRGEDIDSTLSVISGSLGF